MYSSLRMHCRFGATLLVVLGGAVCCAGFLGMVADACNRDLHGIE